MNKICAKCLEEKEIGEFHKNKRRIDGLQRICKNCSSKSDKKYYLKVDKKKKLNWGKQARLKKSKYIDSFKNGGCIKCKENRIYLLDFHHVNPKEKKRNISNLRYKGTYKITENEIKKCILLCANCHREFHYLEKIENITIKQYLRQVTQ